MRKATLLILLLNSAIAGAQVYSWRDSSGEMHYSDQPPADAAAKQLAVPSAPSSAGESGNSKSWSEQELEFRKRRAAAADAEQKSANEQQQSQAKQANCRSARNTLQGLESGTIRYKLGDTGDRVALEGADRDAEVARARAAVDSWCK